MKRIVSLLSNTTPAKLKKYGTNAILSFFISACVLIAIDDIRIRNTDITLERLQNEQLQQKLDFQQRLRHEQDSLLMVYQYYTDTTKHKR